MLVHYYAVACSWALRAFFVVRSALARSSWLDQKSGLPASTNAAFFHQKHVTISEAWDFNHSLLVNINTFWTLFVKCIVQCMWRAPVIAIFGIHGYSTMFNSVNAASFQKKKIILKSLATTAVRCFKTGGAWTDCANMCNVNVVAAYMRAVSMRRKAFNCVCAAGSFRHWYPPLTEISFLVKPVRSFSTDKPWAAAAAFSILFRFGSDAWEKSNNRRPFKAMTFSLSSNAVVFQQIRKPSNSCKACKPPETSLASSSQWSRCANCSSWATKTHLLVFQLKP